MGSMDFFLVGEWFRTNIRIFVEEGKEFRSHPAVSSRVGTRWGGSPGFFVVFLGKIMYNSL
jgi:hypothetical protein